MFSFAKKLKDKLDGAAAGRPESDAYFHRNLSINNGGYGLRVLYVKPDSQASKLGLEAWFDFIVGVNGHDLPMKHQGHASSLWPHGINEDGSFGFRNHEVSGSDAVSVAQNELSMVDYDLLAQELAMVASSPERFISFLVWNAKGGVMRYVTVELQPLAVEKSQNDSDNDPGCWKLFENVFLEIGLTAVSQNIHSATHVWRILNTHQHLPAFQAQLVPYSDYIIGCDSAFVPDQPGTGLLSGGGEALLGKVLSEYYTRHHERLQDDKIPVILHVYNHDFDVLRPVTVYLSRAWSAGQNRGILGCDVGYGLLHRIPEVTGKLEAEIENSGKANENISSSANDAQPNIPVHSLSASPFVPQLSLPRKGKPLSRYAPVVVAEPEANKPGTSEKVETAQEAAKKEGDKHENTFHTGHAGGQSLLGQTTEPDVTESGIQHLNIELGGPTTRDIELGLVAFGDRPVPDNQVTTDASTNGTGRTELKDLAEIEQLLVLDDDLLLEEAGHNGPGHNGPGHNHVPEKSDPEDKANLDHDATITDGTHIDTVIQSEAPKSTADIHVNGEGSNQKTSSETLLTMTPQPETLKPSTEPNISKIDSLLDEDEDFLDHTDDVAVDAKTSDDAAEKPIEAKEPVNTDEDELCDIPLDESQPASSSLLRPEPPQTQNPTEYPEAPKVSSLFSPIQSALSQASQTSQTSPLAPPIPKAGRRRKPHVPVNLGNLTDFMNEELSKSKANDVNYSMTGMDESSNGIPPPPPKTMKR